MESTTKKERGKKKKNQPVIERGKSLVLIVWCGLDKRMNEELEEQCKCIII